jgi:hypothetical protein
MRVIILGLLLGWVLLGCSRAIYGVPAERWARMSEAEQAAAIDRFHRQQAIHAETRRQAELAQQQAEAARREAHEFERQCQERAANGETSEHCQKIRRQRVIWP